jgi:predicted metal-binding membrane protein
MGMSDAAFLGLWSLMMAAMMLPSELPLLRLDHATSRSAIRTGVLASGYLAVWLALGGVVVLLRSAPVRPPVAAVLGAAALYQLTPLKRRCLAVCRAPLARILRGWRDGHAGALLMGVENGIWCVGCCVGLTAALLALGMMSIGWMIVVAVAILVEKTTRVGVGASRASAGALAVGAVLWAI